MFFRQIRPLASVIAVGCVAMGGQAAPSLNTEHLNSLVVEGLKALRKGEMMVVFRCAEDIKGTLLAGAASWEALLLNPSQSQVLSKLSFWILAYTIFRKKASGAAQSAGLSRNEEARLRAAPTFQNLLTLILQAAEVAHSLSSTAKLTRQSWAVRLQELNPEFDKRQLLTFLRNSELKKHWKNLHHVGTVRLDSGGQNQAFGQDSLPTQAEAFSDGIISSLNQPLIRERLGLPDRESRGVSENDTIEQDESVSTQCSSQHQEALQQREPTHQPIQSLSEAKSLVPPVNSPVSSVPSDPALILLTGTVLMCLTDDPWEKTTLKEKISQWVRQQE